MCTEQYDITVDDLNPTFLFTSKVARICDEKNYHCHDHIEVAIILSGKGEYYIDGITYFVEPGDVIVLANKGSMSRALCGEIMSNYAKKRGLAGIIIDGCVRDSYTLSQMDFPVYAKGITPNGPYKNGPGEMNFPVSFGGIIINPGDILVGDSDGLIAIDPKNAEELAKIAKAYHEGEENQLDGIINRGEWPRPWVQDSLEKVGFEFVD